MPNFRPRSVGDLLGPRQRLLAVEGVVEPLEQDVDEILFGLRRHSSHRRRSNTFQHELSRTFCIERVRLAAGA